MRTLRAASGALLLLASLAAPAAGASVTFTDNAFHEGNWSLTTDFAGCAQASATAMRMGPTTQMGYWRYCSLFRQSPTVCPERTWAFSFRIRTDYDPAVSGAVKSVDFSTLAVVFTDPYLGHGLGPALRQNGTVYVCDQLIMQSGTPWLTYELQCLTAADFHVPGGSANPDFSASGAPFECGYFISSDNGSVTVFRVEVDDWSFAINSAECEIVPTRAPTWGELKLRYR